MAWPSPSITYETSATAAAETTIPVVISLARSVTNLLPFHRCRWMTSDASRSRAVQRMSISPTPELELARCTRCASIVSDESESPDLRSLQTPLV